MTTKQKRKLSSEKASNILELALGRLDFSTFIPEYQDEVYKALEYLRETAWKYEDCSK